MSSWWRQTMLYLGLGPDEEYEDYEAGGAPGEPEPSTGATGRGPVDEQLRAPAHPVALAPDPEPEPALSAVRPIPDTGPEPTPAADAPAPMGQGSVRTIAVSNAKPHVVLPSSFDQAQD